jgi:hypothetical protein
MYYPNLVREPRPEERRAVPESIETMTVSDVVRRALALVDPEGRDDIAPELLLAYEDDDRAVVGLGADLWEELRSTVEGLDPEGDSGAAAATAATAAFLSTQPEGAPDDAATIREAVRVAWGEQPPDHVAAWLRDHGVED